MYIVDIRGMKRIGMWILSGETCRRQEGDGLGREWEDCLLLCGVRFTSPACDDELTYRIKQWVQSKAKLGRVLVWDWVEQNGY